MSRPLSPLTKLLLRARALLAKGWTQRTVARNARGEAVKIFSPTATQYCITGAIGRAAWEAAGKPTGYSWEAAIISAQNERVGEAHGLLTRLLPRMKGQMGVERWNDRKGRTQDEVLAFMDNAIAVELKEAIMRAEIEGSSR